jgi:hypothetical protein
MEQVDGAAPSPVDTGMVGDEPHSFAAHERRRTLDEDLDAGTDYGGASAGRRRARRGGCQQQGGELLD